MRSLFQTLLLAGSIALTSCKAQHMNYSWLPTECAPKEYPIEILKGDFFFADGSSIYIPDNQLVNNGWGNFGSTHIVGSEQKPVPVALAVSWYSFRERKFYSGRFDLPAETMQQWFAAGYESPMANGKTTYDNILVGLAPQGGVSVWAMGDVVSRELAHFQAKDTPVRWSEFMSNPEYSQERYSREMLASAGLDSTRLQQPTPPADRWNNQYRKRSAWIPEVSLLGKLQGVNISYFNGEREYLDQQQKSVSGWEERATPANAVIRWATTSGRNAGYEIGFDFDEFQAALDKLSAQKSGTAPLKLSLQIKEASNSVVASLNDGSNMVQLSRITWRYF